MYNSKFSLDNLAIELTRRCNMKCEHCLRGSAQNIDINLKDVKTLFKQINYISVLAITGGEPSLKPKLIIDIVNLAKKNKVDIGSFYIATNGKKITPDFIVAIATLYAYCSDNEISQIQLSNDNYHEYNDNENLLECFSFFSKRGDIGVKSIIKQGRGKEFGCRNLEKEKIYFDSNNNFITEGTLYLNCKGNIIIGCDWSYRSQDRKSNILCNVNNFNTNTIKQSSMVEIED